MFGENKRVAGVSKDYAAVVEKESFGSVKMEIKLPNNENAICVDICSNTIGYEHNPCVGMSAFGITGSVIKKGSAAGQKLPDSVLIVLMYSNRKRLVVYDLDGKAVSLIDTNRMLSSDIFSFRVESHSQTLFIASRESVVRGDLCGCLLETIYTDQIVPYYLAISSSLCLDLENESRLFCSSRDAVEGRKPVLVFTVYSRPVVAATKLLTTIYTEPNNSHMTASYNQVFCLDKTKVNVYSVESGEKVSEIQLVTSDPVGIVYDIRGFLFVLYRLQRYNPGMYVGVTEYAIKSECVFLDGKFFSQMHQFDLSQCCDNFTCRYNSRYFINRTAVNSDIFVYGNYDGSRLVCLDVS